MLGIPKNKTKHLGAPILIGFLFKESRGLGAPALPSTWADSSRPTGSHVTQVAVICLLEFPSWLTWRESLRLEQRASLALRQGPDGTTQQ